MKKSVLNVQMPTKLYEAAKEKAGQQYTSLSTVVRQLLAQWLVTNNGKEPDDPNNNQGK